MYVRHLQEYLDKYPNGNKRVECEKHITELNKKLALKAFENAKQYYTTEYYKSAIISLNNLLLDYPGSIHREDANFLILKASYDFKIRKCASSL